MANLFGLIEEALNPPDPYRPLRTLAEAIGFEVPADVLSERERIFGIYKSAMRRMSELDDSFVHAQMAEERKQARDDIESGEPFMHKLRSKSEIREEVRAESSTIKMGLRDTLAEYAEKCRPVVEHFGALAASHVDALEAKERKECEHYGLGYVRGSLVSGLRRCLAALPGCIPPFGALNSPRSFLPWLND
jgi:hypothetical protein